MTPDTTPAIGGAPTTNTSLFLAPPSVFPIVLSLGPALVVLFLNIVALVKTKLISFQFKFLLHNVALAQMIQWISVTLLFLWYPQVYLLVKEEGVLSMAMREDLQRLCTTFLSLFETAILHYLATISIFAIEVCFTFKTKADSVSFCTMFSSCLIWLVFLITNMLLIKADFGEAGEDGFCTVNHSTPHLWKCQAVVTSQLVAWVLTALICVAIIAYRIRAGKRRFRHYFSVNIPVKTLLALCMVAFSNAILTLLPGFSLLVDLDTGPDLKREGLVVMKQAIPVLTSAPGIVASLLIAFFVSCCNNRRQTRMRIIRIVRKTDITVGGGAGKANTNAVDSDGAEKAKKMGPDGCKEVEKVKMDVDGKGVEKMDSDSK